MHRDDNIYQQNSLCLRLHVCSFVCVCMFLCFECTGMQVHACIFASSKVTESHSYLSCQKDVDPNLVSLLPVAYIRYHHACKPLATRIIGTINM